MLNLQLTIVVCGDSSSATSVDEDSDAETIDTMESSIPDPDVTLDDDLSAADDQDPCPPSGDDSKTKSAKFQCIVILQYTMHELFVCLESFLNWLGGSAVNPTVQVAIP